MKMKKLKEIGNKLGDYLMISGYSREEALCILIAIGKLSEGVYERINKE